MHLGGVYGAVGLIQWWGSADGKRGARWGGGEKGTEAGGITGKESGSETFGAWVVRPTSTFTFAAYAKGRALRKTKLDHPNVDVDGHGRPLLPGTVMET